MWSYEGGLGRTRMALSLRDPVPRGICGNCLHLNPPHFRGISGLIFWKPMVPPDPAGLAILETPGKLVKCRCPGPSHPEILMQRV